MGDDTVQDLAGLELARPAGEGRYPVGALPVGVLLAAPGGDGRIWPGVVVGTVVGRVQHHGVIGYAQFIQRIEQPAHRADRAGPWRRCRNLDR